jgi:hypothetical protein
LTLAIAPLKPSSSVTRPNSHADTADDGVRYRFELPSPTQHWPGCVIDCDRISDTWDRFESDCDIVVLTEVEEEEEEEDVG